ncbi:MAG: rod shape-determining protein [Deltaproteobacteria bacterium]|nr:rod shape-determining protein [Deltaproteobacteria bacterium]
MLFNFIASRVSKDLAIDLGTANTLVYSRGAGIVVDEPSVVAIRKRDKRSSEVWVGADAKKMIGRVPESIEVYRPLRDGVIANFEIASLMLKFFIQKAHGRKAFVRPRVIISVPSGVTPVERRAVRDATLNAGAGEVFVIEEAMAAAMGAGLPVTEPMSNMIVDIGGGTTEVAIISLTGVVYSNSTKVAGDKLDTDILNFVRKNYSMLIGPSTAEQIKMLIGRAYIQNDEEEEIDVKGRDLMDGIPKTITINSSEITMAIMDSVNTIVDNVKSALEQCPPELAADIIDTGIVLTGGGALLKNLDLRVRREIGVPVVVPDDPLTTVVRGAGMMLDDIELLKEISNN